MLICSAILLCNACVLANDDITFNVVRINDTVKISGNAPAYGQKISLIVLNPNREKEELLDFWNAKSVIYYLNQVFSGPDGAFEFSIKFSESIENSEYSLFIGDNYLSTVKEGKFFVLSQSISDSKKAEWDLNQIFINYDGKSSFVNLIDRIDESVGYGSEVTWSSSSSGVTIENDKALIDRSIITSGSISLTATVKYNGTSYAKSFELSVTALSDAEKVSLDESSLNISYNGTDNEILLPSVGIYGSVLSWRALSSDVIVIDKNKAIINRDVLTEDVSEDIVCEIQAGAKTASKKISLLIKAYSNEEKQQIDIDALTVSYNGTDSTITLIDKGEKYGTEIRWSSSDLSIVEIFKKVAVVNRSSLDKDTIVTLTAYAQANSNVSKQFEMTVKKSKGTGSSSSSSGNKSSYIYPKTNVEVIEKPEPEIKSVFNDLNGFEWAKDSIEKLANEGILNGIGEGNFSPSAPVSRAEFVKMIIKAFDLLEDSASASFDDVKDTEWYYPYVASAYKKGIINGVSDTNFGVALTLTREDMAVIIYRAMQFKGIVLNGNETEKFEDQDEISKYAVSSVNSMKNEGIINGIGNGYFAPKSTATRAEAAVIIERCKKALLI